MSNRDATEMLLWLDAEQIGPAWDRFRHADLKAALLNSAGTRADGRPFTVGDFFTDPWADPPKPANAELQKRLIAAELEAMADAFG